MIIDSPELLKQILLSKGKPYNIIALDVGNKKLGIAYYNSAANVAVPLIVISALEPLKLETILKERMTDAVLIGMPYSADGSLHEDRKKKMYAFANSILNRFPVSILFVDERYTSQMADTMLMEAGLNRKKRNQLDDAIAAQLMLQNFIDHS